ncbi:MAG: hypothetical protein LBJ67_02070 [Planctomycetaceae bacterium]|jgi:hypothetical protein|nr:hypothetical protein [Planctomycetaceae bacterium]
MRLNAYFKRADGILQKFSYNINNSGNTPAASVETAKLSAYTPEPSAALNDNPNA